MAPTILEKQPSPLRAITQRLSLTPVKQLPQIVPYLAASLLSCKDILDDSRSHTKIRDGSEVGMLRLKFKTQLTTLLHAREVESRWTAVVLIKTTIEAGGVEVLQGTEKWTRGLLEMMGRPCPTSTKKLCIITLTRIFTLTLGHQTIVRELITPSLPSFITSCLNSVSSKASLEDGRRAKVYSPLLTTVLDAFSELMPNHPSLFRPFVAQIRALLLPLIAPTVSTQMPQDLLETSECASSSSIAAAQHLFVLLHCCAAKNASAEEWHTALQNTIISSHHTADQIFRAVVEDWDWSTVSTESSIDLKKSGDIISNVGIDRLGLPDWQGIYGGCERLSVLLRLAESFIRSSSHSAISLPVGAITNLVTRILSITIPSCNNSHPLRINPEIEREEREGLWASLPQLHASAIQMISAMLERLGSGGISISQGLFERLLWVFDLERENVIIRESIYNTARLMLARSGPSFLRDLSSFIGVLIRSCCEDLWPSSDSGARPELLPTNAIKAPQGNGPPANKDIPLENKRPGSSPIHAKLWNAAFALLPMFRRNLSYGMISFPLMSQIDRTAILIQHKDAMLASVMNPIISRRRDSSIMPFLARGFPEALEVEALIRPRMPPLQRHLRGNGVGDLDEQEAEHQPQCNDNSDMQPPVRAIDSPNLGDVDLNVPMESDNVKSVPTREKRPRDNADAESAQDIVNGEEHLPTTGPTEEPETKRARIAEPENLLRLAGSGLELSSPSNALAKEYLGRKGISAGPEGISRSPAEGKSEQTVIHDGTENPSNPPAMEDFEQIDKAANISAEEFTFTPAEGGYTGDDEVHSDGEDFEIPEIYTGSEPEISDDEE